MRTVYESPLGCIIIESAQDAMGTRAIKRLDFAKEGEQTHHLPQATSTKACAAISLCAQELDEYFLGTRKTFSVPVMLEGTVFRERVWAELAKIPYGVTISYGELARRVGNNKASRAVGSANGCNPISIIIPCHRVIASDNTLGGYGGGLHRKVWLLRLETGMEYRQR